MRAYLRGLVAALSCLLQVACGGTNASPDAAVDATLDGPDAPVDGALVDAGPPPMARAAASPLTQWVDPFIGTGGLGFGYAAAYPGPQMPFGMVRPGPDTTTAEGASPLNHFSGYYYGDTMVQGFSHTRVHGTGIVDYGVVALMPTDGMSAEKTHQDGYRSPFDKASESASPGYYRVRLDEGGIDAELTATHRVAVHRYVFDEAADPVVVVDVGHFIGEVEIVDGAIEVDADAREVFGFSHFSGGYSDRFGGVPIYFVARFDQEFASHGVWQAGSLAEGESARSGADTGAYLRFAGSRTVQAAVGISFVDVEHARMNLDAEQASIDFDATRAAAESAWQEALSAVEIEGRSETQFRVFYTALYHALMMPTLATDVDGSYRGIDGERHVADGFTYYTDFSLWDTFRTLHPLLTLIYPAWQTDFLRSLVAMAEDGGFMPRWPLGIGYTGGMVGESATVVFADSYLKGLRDFDLRAAYDAMRRTASTAPPAGASYGGRGGIEDYDSLGWVPMDRHGGSASMTLEYAYNDHAMAALAEALGETEDQALFEARAGNWRNLYDEGTGFLLGRNADGTFPTDLDPLVWEDFYVEGNAWQYMWYAPHDLDGLAEAMGGPDAFLERLHGFFEMSSIRPVNPLFPANYYWHGNEPDIHAPFMFSHFDDIDGTAKWTRWTNEEHYDDTPAGIPGNDDGGTLAAWYVFSALGFFPIAGTEHYLLGSPLVTAATVHLPGGDVVIEAPESSESALYVEAASLAGVALPRPRFDHAAIVDGATLRFEMSAVPGGW